MCRQFGECRILRHYLLYLAVHFPTGVARDHEPLSGPRACVEPRNPEKFGAMFFEDRLRLLGVLDHFLGLGIATVASSMRRSPLIQIKPKSLLPHDVVRPKYCDATSPRWRRCPLRVRRPGKNFLTFCSIVGPVHLQYRLRNIETNRSNLAHGQLTPCRSAWAGAQFSDGGHEEIRRSCISREGCSEQQPQKAFPAYHAVGLAKA
jgi:hypothetical protein